ncbi:hypothetical protein JAAARDRAFT_41759 [Jaapia argillacea MUCL 33604]|uniref:Uncharacterized protein n=1 Tax=Jaapia argillacea MUCL 33604 TaxID=933084 RepID=A0A067P7S6_9AGAM|nr:hypothetical protein JAAARDRAFT_41759 [Jaapia argillacea MUCL 33604]
MPINRKQPFETVYIIFLTLDVLSRIPYWTLKYIFPSNRPRPTWSLAACLTTAQTKHMYSRRMIAHGYQADAFAVDQVPDQKTLKKSTVVVIPPAKEKYLKGMALLDPSVGPVVTTGYFYGNHRETTKAATGETVWLLSHGGTFSPNPLPDSRNPNPTPGAYLNSSAREHSWTTTQAYELLNGNGAEVCVDGDGKPPEAKGCWTGSEADRVA